MKNYSQPGKVLTLTAPYDVAAGAGALVGVTFGVACSAVANGAEGEFALEGVFELTKVGSQAWGQGVAVYWDNSNKRCTTVASGNYLIGVSTEVLGNGAGVVLGKVRLNSSFGPAAS